MFNTSRVPAKPADYPIKYPAAEHKYILVIRKNQFFKVFHEVDGKQLNTSELEQQFKRVYEIAQKAPAVGALTSENRDIWTDAREKLLKAHPSNAQASGTLKLPPLSSAWMTLRQLLSRSERINTGMEMDRTDGTISLCNLS